MHEPIRLKPVTVMLDVYRQGIVAVGQGVGVAGAVGRNVVRRGVERVVAAARRFFRPPGELLPSLICQRIKAAKGR